MNPDTKSPSNDHWFPWLQKHLLIRGILTQTPEIPSPWKPEYPLWKKEFERYDVTPETILVGHSCGGGFLVRWLSETKIKVGKLVLVAPWLDPFRDEGTGTFFDFSIDPKLTDRIDKITIFNSDDDHKSVHESVKMIRDKVNNIRYQEYHNYGHFCLNDLKTEKFPELLDEILMGLK